MAPHKTADAALRCARSQARPARRPGDEAPGRRGTPDFGGRPFEQCCHSDARLAPVFASRGDRGGTRTPVLLPHCSSERDAYPHLISAKRTPGTVACDDNDKPCWSPALTIAGVRGICDGSDEKSRKSGVLRLKANLREDDRPDKFGFLPHGPPCVLISTQTWAWSLR